MNGMLPSPGFPGPGPGFDGPFPDVDHGYNSDFGGDYNDEGHRAKITSKKRHKHKKYRAYILEKAAPREHNQNRSWTRAGRQSIALDDSKLGELSAAMKVETGMGPATSLASLSAAQQEVIGRLLEEERRKDKTLKPRANKWALDGVTKVRSANGSYSKREQRLFVILKRQRNGQTPRSSHWQKQCQQAEIIDLADPLPHAEAVKSKRNDKKKMKKHDDDDFFWDGLGGFDDVPAPGLDHVPFSPPPGAIPVGQWHQQHHQQGGPLPLWTGYSHEGNPFQANPQFNDPDAFEMPHGFDHAAGLQQPQPQQGCYQLPGAAAEPSHQYHVPGAFETPPATIQGDGHDSHDLANGVLQAPHEHYAAAPHNETEPVPPSHGRPYSSETTHAPSDVHENDLSRLEPSDIFRPGLFEQEESASGSGNESESSDAEIDMPVSTSFRKQIASALRTHEIAGNRRTRGHELKAAFLCGHASRVRAVSSQERNGESTPRHLNGLDLDLERLHADCQFSNCTLKMQFCRQIVHSKYDRLQETGYSHALLLRLVYANASSRNTRPLFTWTHFRQDMLDHGQFARHVYSLIHAKPELLKHTKLHFDRVRSSRMRFFGDRSISQLSSYSELSEVSNEGEVDLTMLSACLPFVCLRTGLADQTRKRPSTDHQHISLFQHFGKTGTSGQDHKQVFQQMAGADRSIGHLYVSQLWIFQINNEMLFTCSTHGESELWNAQIQTHPVLSPQHNMTSLAACVPTIRVTTPNGRLWSLRRADCITWLDFTSQFHGIGVSFSEDFVVVRNKVIVTQNDWHSVVEDALSSIVDLHLRDREAFPTLYLPKLGQTDTADLVARVRQHTRAVALSLTHAQGSTWNLPRVVSITDITDDLLQYVQSIEGWCSAVLQRLDEQALKRPKKARSRTALNFVVGLTSIFSVFIGLRSKGQTLQIHRKADRRLLKAIAKLFCGARESVIPASDLPSSVLDSVWHCVKPIMETAAELHSDGLERSVFLERGSSVSKELLHVQTQTTNMLIQLGRYVGHYRRNGFGSDHTLKTMGKQASESLRSCFENLPARLDGCNIRKMQAGQPDAVVAQLCHSITDFKVHQGRTSAEIGIGEADRKTLEKIRMFQYELSASRDVQQQQLTVIDELHTRLIERPEDDDKDTYDGDEEFSQASASFHHCTASLKSKIEQIDSWLEACVVHRSECEDILSEAQDWRENAAVVFTSVTVIFLPLQFVAGLFGMNTSDFRDLNHGQWIFWASAIPFTLLVMLLALFWVDAPLGSWTKSLWHRVKPKRHGKARQRTFRGQSLDHSSRL